MAAAARLIERGRLASLSTDARWPRQRSKAAEIELDAAAREVMTSSEAVKAIRQIVKETHLQLDRTREAIAAAEHESQAKANSSALSPRQSTAPTLRWKRRVSTVDAHSASALGELASLGELEAALETAKSSAAEQRSIHARAEAALEGFEREVRLRQERIQAIGAEQALWQKRIANAREQIATLARPRGGDERRSCRARQSAGRDRAAAFQTSRCDRGGRARAQQGGRRSRSRRDRIEASGEGLARGAGAAGRSTRKSGPHRGAA